MNYFTNELGRLIQGVGDRVKETNTIFSLAHDQIPKYRRNDVKYGQIVWNCRPQKYEPHSTSLVSEENLISFIGNAGIRTANITI